MIYKGPKPNTWTYNIFINVLINNGEVEKAEQEFRSMKGIESDIVMYNTLVHGLSK